MLDTLAQLGMSDRPGVYGADVDGAGLEAAGGEGGRLPGVVAIGHSAGGAALLLAEESRPGTFSRIWAWEPIMSIPGSDDRAQRGAELARRARQRRAEFASIDEARAHFQGRQMFAEFSPESFEAFLDGGLVPNDGGGYRLACDPEVEARIYEGAAAHSAWDGLGRVHCPTRLLGGELSPAVPPDELETIAGQLPGLGPEGKGLGPAGRWWCRCSGISGRSRGLLRSPTTLRTGLPDSIIPEPGYGRKPFGTLPPKPTVRTGYPVKRPITRP